MLVLSRKYNENIIIGDNIVVKVVRLEGDTVKLGIEAPPEISVHRQEVYEEILRTNKSSLQKGGRSLPKSPKSDPKKDAS